MVSQNNEAAPETHIENTLARDGYRIGNPADFDREFAIDGKLFWQFLEATQPKELAKLKDRPNWQRLLLERLNKKIKKDSVLAALKKGLDIDDAHFDLLYRLPYNDLNPDVLANFEANVFSVTRQVHYSESDTFKSVDIVLFVNGLTIATLELKNPWTGQNVHNAIKQYRTDRDPGEPLFEFGRCLVHFAVDPDEAYMCTRLAGNGSNFLPFNQGFNFGRGNPVNPKGHKTAYLWEDILPRRSLTNIMEQFARFTVEKDKKTGKERKALFFPRYHQLDVVRRILADAKQRGVGQTYLIQHSAGSGKSNSITWLAYQLVELYDTAVLAVQALSRLNRCNWKLGKTDTFVLDFYNTVDDIKTAFDPFYTATTLCEPTDVNVLHDLKDALDGFGIYDWPEVTTFNEKFFASAEAEELHPIIDTVVARFEADLDDEQRIDFKIKAKQFVKIYAQVVAIIPFNNMNWEMLHWFLKFLVPKLKVKDPDQDKLDELLSSIDLSTYGLERSRLEVKIGLDASEAELEPQNPNVRGGHFSDDDKDPLDEIVRAFNERHFAGWEATPEEQRVKFINIAKHVMKHTDYKAQVEDNPDRQNRQLALERLIQQAISVERRRELDLYRRYASDPDFKRAFDASISRLLNMQDFANKLTI